MRECKQRGASPLGFLAILVIGGFLLTAVFKIGPLFVDYYFVDAALQALAQEDIDQMKNRQIRRIVSDSFTVNSVRDVDIKTLQIERDKTGTLVYFDYEKRVNFIANVDIVAVFHTEYDSSK
ncbi:MAG: DUF4845 domain-containing protein [Porticoccaceae bacterium]|nr:DUF4845 domain-containing protein [Porticoccaceae bacterium]